MEPKHSGGATHINRQTRRPVKALSASSKRLIASLVESRHGEQPGVPERCFRMDLADQFQGALRAQDFWSTAAQVGFDPSAGPEELPEEPRCREAGPKVEVPSLRARSKGLPADTPEGANLDFSITAYIPHESEERWRRDGADDPAPDCKSDIAEVDCDYEKIPPFPFPGHYSLSWGKKQVHIHEHQSQQGGCAHNLVFFLPGAFGGVGPGRKEGDLRDRHALFASVAGVLELCHTPIKAYRLSWSRCFPDESDLVPCVLRAVHHAVLQASRGPDFDGDHRFKVFFVGHSFGGLVTLSVAQGISSYFSCLKKSRRSAFYEVEVAGVCCLNTAGFSDKASDERNSGTLSQARALFVCGDSDETIPPVCTLYAHVAVKAAKNRLMILRGGTHGLEAHKEELTKELALEITEAFGAVP